MADIRFDKVVKSFSSSKGNMSALEEIDFEIADNEFVAIVGPSGCGKSTLLNLVAGFDAPTQGAVLVGGRPAGPPGPDRAVVFQEIALFPWLSVQDNTGFALKLRANRSPEEQKNKVDELLRRVGLWDFRHHMPAQLSGGMKQRVAIARVLTFDPEVLLMDEPFGALDALTRTLMQDFLLELWEERRQTVLFITHDIDEAIYLADRVAIMTARPGRIREMVPVPLPRPRNFSVQNTSEFIHLREKITLMVREEASKAHVSS